MHDYHPIPGYTPPVLVYDRDRDCVLTGASLPRPPTRIRMGVEECTLCGLAVQYCKGHAPPDAPSKDAATAAADLSARIRAAYQRDTDEGGRS